MALPAEEFLLPGLLRPTENRKRAPRCCGGLISYAKIEKVLLQRGSYCIQWYPEMLGID